MTQSTPNRTTTLLHRISRIGQKQCLSWENDCWTGLRPSCNTRYGALILQLGRSIPCYDCSSFLAPLYGMEKSSPHLPRNRYCVEWAMTNVRKDRSIVHIPEILFRKESAITALHLFMSTTANVIGTSKDLLSVSSYRTFWNWSCFSLRLWQNTSAPSNLLSLCW